MRQEYLKVIYAAVHEAGGWGLVSASNTAGNQAPSMMNYFYSLCTFYSGLYDAECVPFMGFTLWKSCGFYKTRSTQEMCFFFIYTQDKNIVVFNMHTAQ